MIKTLLKQLILEECLNFLFSNIQININPIKSTNYRFEDYKEALSKNRYVYRSRIYFLHNNQEDWHEMGRIGNEKDKISIIDSNHKSLINRMNDTIYLLNKPNKNIRGASTLRYIDD